MLLVDPGAVMDDAGLTPDPWQRDVLQSPSRRFLLLCARQSGKSQVAAALALHAALTEPGSLILLVSRGLRQAGELFRDKFLRLYRNLGRPVPSVRETALELTLDNGSRVISLPGEGDVIVGYSNVRLLVIDEAARVPDDLYKVVRPMLAVSDGALVALSTPNGRRGWFYEAWKSEEEWERVRVRAEQCPRISPAFLAEERVALGDLWYRQEYETDFVAVEGAEWPPEYFDDDLLFTDWPPLVARVLALDPSKGRNTRSSDYAAFVLLGADAEGVLWIEADMLRGKGVEFLAATAVDHCFAWRPDTFGVEITFDQQLFATMINEEAAIRGLPIPLVEMDNRVPKEVRIRRLGPYLRGRKLRFRDTPGTKILLQQMQEFPESATDDGPDSCEMAVRLIGDYLRVLPEGALGTSPAASRGGAYSTAPRGTF
jgi:phage terminase large subunit-like protein